jgi:hypothetical protein
MKNRLLFLLVILTIAVIFGACESEAPLENQSTDTLVIYDSTFVFDTTVVYDTTVIYDTTIVYDSVFVYDTLWIIDTIFVYDSTVFVDTVFVNDTTVIYDSTFVYDTLLVYDTTIVYDSVFVFDTTVIYDTVVVIDSVWLPTDTMVYQDCLILRDCDKTGTLGEPGHFVTVSRDKTNGHAIKFCLFVYRRDDIYFGVLSATHLKSDWPVVDVHVKVNDLSPFTWRLDQDQQSLDIVF